MAEKVNLKIMKCPTCGAGLKVTDKNEAIICVYCGNSIVPVVEAAPIVQNDVAVSGVNGLVKVEGIKTASSAMAYMEQLFEEYDWDAFAYERGVSIPEVDKLVNSYKMSSADDKNTWIACCKAISVPFIHKVDGCKRILDSVIEEYKKDSLEAYSKFDAYKRVCAMLHGTKNSVIANLEKISATAVKYGASLVEIQDMNKDVENIRNIDALSRYNKIEDIPEIKSFIEKKNANIAQELLAKGIDANSEYLRAKELIAEQNYVGAMRVLTTLKGYQDTNDLIEKIDKYFCVSDIVEIGENLYYFKQNSSEGKTFNLHSIVDGKISSQEIIKNVSQVVTNYADILYYLDDEKKLKKYNFSTKTEVEIYNKPLDEKHFYIHNENVYLLTLDTELYGPKKQSILALDIVTGDIKIVVEKIKSIISFTDDKFVYTISKKSEENTDSYEVKYDVYTNVINVDTMVNINLGKEKISVEGFCENYVVYTKKAPNDYNKNLCIKALNSEEPEKLIEKNIYSFFDVISNRLFYYVGNSKNKNLINLDIDGANRSVWPFYISEFLFEQGGWLYFLRKSGYNSVLCKSRSDGSRFSIVAREIERFIDIKNGYLYYINDASTLVKVRMDGSNSQELCYFVENVLSVKEDKIIFVSVDDKIKTNNLEYMNGRSTKSIYAIDFSSTGIIKLVYNIKSAKEYDENTIYYIAECEAKVSNESVVKKIDTLYKIDVNDYQIDKLADLEVPQTEKESSLFTNAMIVMGIAFALAFFGIVGGSAGVFVLCFLTGFVALIVGLIDKYDNAYEVRKNIAEIMKSNSSNDVKLNKIGQEIKNKAVESANKAVQEMKDNINK